MSDTIQIQPNPLDHAEVQLREICESHAQFEESIDTGSLNRMLVHIRNINASVCSSTRDHINAAKRLTDFATTLGRLASKSFPLNAELATRIANLSTTLRDAGAEIAGGASMPRWASQPCQPAA
jgi:hypothetical protein